jgi:transposase
MDYPEAVTKKAKQYAELVKRVESGESREQVCEDLGIQVDEERLAVLQTKYKAGGERWQALLDGRHGHSQKMHSEIREWLYERKKQNEELRSRALAKEIEKKFGVKVSAGHVNYLLRKRGLAAPPGRPSKGKEEKTEKSVSETTESLENAGIFFPGSSEGGNGNKAGGGEVCGGSV